MNAEEFCHWLKGWFDVSMAGAPLDADLRVGGKQLGIIREQLAIALAPKRVTRGTTEPDPTAPPIGPMRFTGG